jgi:ribonuclease P protein component
MKPPRGGTFPRSCRLKSPYAIRAILHSPQSGRRRWDAFRVVWSQPYRRRDGDGARFAFVVSKRAGAATMRNRIKRRLREAVRLQKDVWPVAAEIILYTDSALSARLPFEELTSRISEALTWVKKQTADIA